MYHCVNPKPNQTKIRHTINTMAAASSPLSSSLSTTSSLISKPHLPSHHPLAISISVRSPLSPRFPSLTSLHLRLRLPPLPSLSNGSGNNGDKSNGSGNQGGGGGGHGDDDDEESGWEENRNEALFVLANLGRSLDSLPLDLAEAVRDGKVNGEIITRFVGMEKSPLFKWLMGFGGFKERLLADDLFLAKVLMECGVGIFTKTAAEYQKRKENFVKELDFVIADVVMAIVADFMLVWLPAPTVSLRSSVAVGVGPIAKFFHGCPDNAFQVALAGRSYSLMERIGAIVRNGSKLFVVGTGSSLIGTGVTNALIKARKAVDKENAHEGEDVPIVATSVGYGVYMAVSSNLRYQILAGVIEQRVLEPLLHNHKGLLSAMCFAVRTGNTFLGSLLWVDYARWIGIQ